MLVYGKEAYFSFLFLSSYGDQHVKFDAWTAGALEQHYIEVSKSHR